MTTVRERVLATEAPATRLSAVIGAGRGSRTSPRPRMEPSQPRRASSGLAVSLKGASVGPRDEPRAEPRHGCTNDDNRERHAADQRQERKEIS